MSENTLCPATMCPYLGLTQGSPWTGDESAACESACDWNHGGSCLAGREHDMDVWGIEGPMPPRDMWPSCQYESECQWQAQRDGPCAPRAMLMMGLSVEQVQLG